MTIYERIKKELENSMRDKDEIRLTTLRGIISAFTNELISQKKRPNDEVTDDMALTVIKRAAKQRKDSIEQFTKGGRTELAENEEKELAILTEYLPEMMSEDEILKTVQKIKAEMGNTESKGSLMGAIMKELKGKASGEDVRRIVENLDS